MNKEFLTMAEQIAKTAREKLLNLISDSLEDRELTDAERDDIRNRIADELTDIAELFQAFGFNVDDLEISIIEKKETLMVTVQSTEGSGFTALLKKVFEKTKVN